MRTDDSFWTISVNFAKNWNKLLETYNGKDMNMSDMTGNSRSYVIGKPVGNIMGYKTTGYIQSEEDIEYYYRQDGTYRASRETILLRCILQTRRFTDRRRERGRLHQQHIGRRVHRQ